MKYDKETLAYAAGFLEADGCVQLTGIRVTNRCLDVLDWFEENFGGQVRSKVVPEGCWEWNLHAAEAASLVQELYPYLLFKKPQVDLFLEYRKTIGARGNKVPEATLNVRNELKQRLTKEKNKWKQST